MRGIFLMLRPIGLALRALLDQGGEFAGTNFNALPVFFGADRERTRSSALRAELRVRSRSAPKNTGRALKFVPANSPPWSRRARSASPIGRSIKKMPRIKKMDPFL